MIHVRVPATTANLGPGFDCLGLALNLWNEAWFETGYAATSVAVEGVGAGALPEDETSLVIQAARLVAEAAGRPLPGLRVRCHNRIPLAAGLGSSAAAACAGLLGANALLGDPLSRAELLRLAVELEGHADNAAAALWGGLVVVAPDGDGWQVCPQPLAPGLQVAIATPAQALATRQARAALPAQVNHADAVYTLGRLGLLLSALRQGSQDLLCAAMDDRLHQPYRFPLIQGGAQAAQAARAAGAAAAISGSGPSIAAFCFQDARPAEHALRQAYQALGLPAEVRRLEPAGAAAVLPE